MGPQLCLAGLIFVVAGQVAAAKDLPRDPHVNKTTGCEWAGPDFAKVDGSDTCVRVGGSVRAEYGATFGRGGSGSMFSGR